jgi:hypothetical protein
MSMSPEPMRANDYSVLIETKQLDHDNWETVHEYEKAYTAADAIVQVELRWKHKGRIEKAYVASVEPRNK